MRPELAYWCPKCGALPGAACISVKTGGRMFAWPYDTHKKRRMAAILGTPSTEPFPAVPVRLRTLKRRSRVGAVDSAIKSLGTGYRDRSA
jgi:hypothetical protein